MNDRWSRRERVCFALAAIAYLATSVFVLRNVALHPTSLLPHNSGIDKANQQLGHFDQSMVVSVVTRNADLLLTEPWNLLGYGQCYPFPRSFTLGEHMFGEGLQMALPWLLTGDPILAYNLMLVLTLWLPGIAMYLLAHHFTRHAGASFVAGLLLLMSPPRIIDGGHPYLHAEFWLPLILLLLHRLFTTERRWLTAAGIGALLALEALETIYVLFAVAIVAGAYGLHLAIRYRQRLPRIALPLFASLVFSIGIAWIVLGPYFDTRQTWDVLSGRPTALFPIATYGRGSPYFIGVLAAVLVAIGLADRFFRRREIDGDDPRLAFLAAAALIVWASVAKVPIPGTDLSIPGLFVFLADVVPGLDAVRGLFAVTIGLWVPVAFLAGYGALLLMERLRRPAMIAVVAVLSLAILAERSSQTLTRWSFGTPLELAAWEARPPEDDIMLIQSVSQGAILDVPMPPPTNAFSRMALSRHLLLQSWNPHPSSSCYNSFDTPLASQIFQLSSALPNAGAAEALASLGFGTVLSHKKSWWPPHLLRWNTVLENEPRTKAIMPTRGESTGLIAYGLEPHAAVRDDRTMLGGRGQGPPVELTAREDDPSALVVPFVFHNPGPETFRHPPPIAPRDARLGWQRNGLAIGSLEEVRVLWPIALGAGGIMRVDVTSKNPPPPGSYLVTLRAAEDPDRVMATRDVIVPTPSRAEPTTSGS